MNVVTKPTADDVLDALAVALEKHEGVGVADVQAWVTKQASAIELADTARRAAACKVAYADAAMALEDRFSDVEHDDLKAVVIEALSAPPVAYFDAAFVAGWDEPDPEYIHVVPGLIVEGMIHWNSGKHASGKSTVAAFCALERLRQGGPVVWLDYEIGPRQARKRFRNVGVTAELAENLRYRYQPPITGTDAATVAALRAEIEALDRPLVVIDSMSKALAGAGCDENSNGDVSRFTDAILQRALKGAGATVFVIDHEGRNQTKSSDYVSRGASTKDADADITYRYFMEEEPDMETVGTLRVVCQKDRDSALTSSGLWERSKFSRRGERWFSVGDGRGNLPVTAVEQPDIARKDGEAARLKHEIVDFLRSNPGETFKLAALRDEMRGQGVTFSNAEFGPTVRAMARDGIYEIEVTEGSRGSLEIAHGQPSGDGIAL